MKQRWRPSGPQWLVLIAFAAIACTNVLRETTGEDQQADTSDAGSSSGCTTTPADAGDAGDADGAGDTGDAGNLDATIDGDALVDAGDGEAGCIPTICDKPWPDGCCGCIASYPACMPQYLCGAMSCPTSEGGDDESGLDESGVDEGGGLEAGADSGGGTGSDSGMSSIGDSGCTDECCPTDDCGNCGAGNFCSDHQCLPCFGDCCDIDGGDAGYPDAGPDTCEYACSTTSSGASCPDGYCGNVTGDCMPLGALPVCNGGCPTSLNDAGLQTQLVGYDAGFTAASCSTTSDCQIQAGDVITATVQVIDIWGTTPSTIFACKGATLFDSVTSDPTCEGCPTHTQLVTATGNGSNASVSATNWVNATVTEAVEGGIQKNALFGEATGSIQPTGKVTVGVLDHKVGLGAFTCMAHSKLVGLVGVYAPPATFLVSRASAVTWMTGHVGAPYELVIGDGTVWNWNSTAFTSAACPKFNFNGAYDPGWSGYYCSESAAWWSYGGNTTTVACGPSSVCGGNCTAKGGQAPWLYSWNGLASTYATDYVQQDFVQKCSSGARPMLIGGQPNPHYLQTVPLSGPTE